MSGNSVQIRRLYYIYTYIGLALCVLAGNLVAYEVPLRAGLSMAQFGLVLSAGAMLPSIVNMLTAPMVTRYRLEYWAVIVLPILRIFLGTAFVTLPLLTRDLSVLTVGLSTIFVLYMTCPYISNNALQSVIKRVIPEEELGKHTSRLLLWQFIPGTLLGIAATYVVQRFDTGDAARFYKVVLVALGVTSLFQVACSVVAFRMMQAERGQPGSTQEEEKNEAKEPEKPRAGGVMGWVAMEVVGPMLPPFLDARFRLLMRQYFFVAVVTAMSQSFVFPYFRQALGWSLMEFQTLAAMMICMGMVFMPAWGALTDRLGGKNVAQATQMLCGLTLLILASGQTWGLWVYILAGFYGLYGLVGSGISIGQQYLTVSFADKRLTGVYMAGFTLVCGVGASLGALMGGALLEWLRIKTGQMVGPVHYEVFFMICGMGHLVCGWMIGSLPDARPSLTRAQVGYELMMTLLKTLRLHRL